MGSNRSESDQSMISLLILRDSIYSLCGGDLVVVADLLAKWISQKVRVNRPEK